MLKQLSVYMLLISVFWSMYVLPTYAQKDTAQLRIWHEEAQVYFEKEGNMYYKNLKDEIGVEKWLRKNIRLNPKRLPYKLPIIGIDNKRKARKDWVLVNKEIQEGVIWAHIVVNEEGEPVRIAFLKKLFPVFEEALYDVLLVMPFKRSEQSFRDYFLAVAFFCIDEGFWSVKVL